MRKPIFPSVCIFTFSDMLLDQHELSGPVGPEARKRIREALLKHHHHQNHKKLANRIPIVRSFADIGKKQSEPHSMDKNGEPTGRSLTHWNILSPFSCLKLQSFACISPKSVHLWLTVVTAVWYLIFSFLVCVSPFLCLCFLSSAWVLHVCVCVSCLSTPASHLTLLLP